MKNRPTASRDDMLIAELVRANTDALRALSCTVSELAALLTGVRLEEASRSFDPTTVKTIVSPELLAQLRPPEMPDGEDTAVARPSRMPARRSNKHPE